MHRRSHIIDMRGMRIGNWMVKSLAPKTARTTEAYWICECACGTIAAVSGSSLRNGMTKSCGCTKAIAISETRTGKHQRLRVRIPKGTRFSKLVTTGTWKHGSFGTLWRCKCDCGGITWVTGPSLKRGNTKSCGCLIGQHFREMLGDKHHNYNPSISAVEREASRICRTSSDSKWDAIRRVSLEKANYVCKSCGVYGGFLVSHHVENWKDNPDIRYELDNLVVLCQSCHMKFHRMFGFKHTNKTQLDSFLSSASLTKKGRKKDSNDH